MKIIFLTKNIKLTSKLKEYVEKKINVLGHICKDAMEAWVELDNDSNQQSGNKKYRAEVQIKLHHSSLRAEETSYDIIAAINEIIPKLRKQIEKFKTRFNNVRKIT